MGIFIILCLYKKLVCSMQPFLHIQHFSLQYVLVSSLKVLMLSTLLSKVHNVFHVFIFCSNPGRNQCSYVEHSTLHDNILRWSYQVWHLLCCLALILLDIFQIGLKQGAKGGIAVWKLCNSLSITYPQQSKSHFLPQEY